MGELLLFIAVALTVAAIVFGVTVLVSGGDPGLTPVEPDGRSTVLPGDRPLGEEDIVRTRFDTVLRGYRMSQVDQALQRAAYDIGYKGELISVLEAEVLALREGRTDDADVLRRAREAAAQSSAQPSSAQPSTQSPADQPPGPDDEPGDVMVSAIAFDPGTQADELSPSPSASSVSSQEAEASAVGRPAPRGAQTPDGERAERR